MQAHTTERTHAERLALDLGTGGVARIGSAEERQKPSTEAALDGKTLLVITAGDAGTCAHRILDERDAALVADRLDLRERLHAGRGALVGDYVDFADGARRRISHDWGDDVQTSDAEQSMGFHLARSGHCTFSGGLHPAIPITTLSETSETREGAAWIFHHDRPAGGNGVTFWAPFRVWRCELRSDERRVA